MKVFYKYSVCQASKFNQNTLMGGDIISEYHIMKAISKFAEVVYDTPDRDCDIYYVRANPKLFKSLPNPKIYFVSPYEKGAFECADAISTFTEPWTDCIKAGKITWDSDIICKNKGITINQVIDDKFKPLQNHPRTKQIREEIGGDFIIGHFGALRKSNYPYSFLHILPKIIEKYPNVKVIFGGNKPINSSFIENKSFEYYDMPYAISACDLILYNMRTIDANIVGSMKVLESMACGVPVFSPKVKSREWELGDNYEYFHPFEINNGRYSEFLENKMFETISMIIEDEKLRNDISKRLISRSEYWNVDNSANRFEKIFKEIIDGVKK